MITDIVLTNDEKDALLEAYSPLNELVENNTLLLSGMSYDILELLRSSRLITIGTSHHSYTYDVRKDDNVGSDYFFRVTSKPYIKTCYMRCCNHPRFARIPRRGLDRLIYRNMYRCISCNTDKNLKHSYFKFSN